MEAKIIDFFLIILTMFLMLSVSDFTAWLMIKIPILGKVTEYLWNSPRVSFLVLLYFIIIGFYFETRLNKYAL